MLENRDISDLSAVKNATDMDDKREVSLAWVGLFVGVAPVVGIILLIVVENFV